MKIDKIFVKIKADKKSGEDDESIKQFKQMTVFNKYWKSFFYQCYTL